MYADTRSPRLLNRVRERRKALGWTQEKLAEEAGVTRQTVNHAENIEGRQVTMTVCIRLAQALDCDVAWLFYEEERAS